MITVRTNSPTRVRRWRPRSATALAAVGALLLTSGMVMLSAPAATAQGNNGTLKVLNAESGAEFKDNEPKVCSFKYEGFGFDAGQAGNMVVEGQGQTAFGPVTVAGVTANQDEVAQVVARYNLLAVPVVDSEGRLAGIVTVDDAMDAILPTAWKKRLPRLFART